jgi:hypothetical protein
MGTPFRRRRVEVGQAIWLPEPPVDQALIPGVGVGLRGELAPDGAGGAWNN